MTTDRQAGRQAGRAVIQGRERARVRQSYTGFKSAWLLLSWAIRSAWQMLNGMKAYRCQCCCCCCAQPTNHTVDSLEHAVSAVDASAAVVTPNAHCTAQTDHTNTAHKHCVMGGVEHCATSQARQLPGALTHSARPSATSTPSQPNAPFHHSTTTSRTLVQFATEPVPALNSPLGQGTA